MQIFKLDGWILYVHEPIDKHHASKQWSVIEEKIDVAPSKSARNAVISSVMRGVFNYSQQHLVAVKEGETLLLQYEQDDDCFIEAVVMCTCHSLAYVSTCTGYGRRSPE